MSLVKEPCVLCCPPRTSVFACSSLERAHVTRCDRFLKPAPRHASRSEPPTKATTNPKASFVAIPDLRIVFGTREPAAPYARSMPSGSCFVLTSPHPSFIRYAVSMLVIVLVIVLVLPSPRRSPGLSPSRSLWRRPSPSPSLSPRISLSPRPSARASPRLDLSR